MPQLTNYICLLMSIAERIAVRLETLIRGVFYTEAQLDKWHTAQRRKHMEDQMADLEGN